MPTVSEKSRQGHLEANTGSRRLDRDAVTLRLSLNSSKNGWLRSDLYGESNVVMNEDRHDEATRQRRLV